MAKKKKVVWCYAVMRSMFGDFWVGKIQAKANEITIFKNIETAIEKAKELFLEMHMDFDPDEDEYDADCDALMAWENVIDITEETVEIIKKKMEKFIV